MDVPVTTPQNIVDLSEMFLNRMADFEKELQDITASTATSSPVSKLAAEFKNFRTFVMTSLQNLQSQVTVLTGLYEHQEIRSRRKMLLIHGVTETANEDLPTSIASIFSKQLKLPDINADCVSRCHRFGNKSGDKSRPIVIKFHTLSDRDKVWFSKTNLKNSGITISEFLIKSRHDVFMEARKRYGISKCWTNNGYIVILAPDGSRHRICTMNDLKSMPAPESVHPVASSSRINQRNPRGTSRTRKAKEQVKRTVK